MHFKLFLSVLLLMLCSIGYSQINPFSNLNSSYDEQNPILSPDGQSLYFTRSKHPSNIGGERDLGDIWVSTLGPTGWSSPTHPSEINNFEWNGVVGFENDNELILHNHYSTGSMIKTQGLSSVSKNGDRWSNPKNISIQYFKNQSENFGGSLSEDGKILVVSLETFSTRGAEDIYISFFRNDKWSEPKNLGNTINTKFQEFTPFIYNDSLLYFASNGHKGKGSVDIFVSKRLDDTWLKWSEPENVKEVNTKGRELGYRQYEGFSLYTSTLDSDGYGDIKMYTELPLDSMFNQNIADEEIVNIAELSTDEIPDNSIMLYGTVASKTTSEVLSPQIKITSNDAKQKVKFENDVYFSNLKSPGTYKVTVAAPGYLAQQETIELMSGEAKKLQKNFVLDPIAVGARVNMKDVLFKQSKPEILESSFSQLDLVVDMLKQNPSMKIKLEGHTDNRGVAKHNLALSKKRAEAVEDYLVSKGVSSKRISGKGYGGKHPIADNEDPNLRKLNRRVEFIIIKD